MSRNDHVTIHELLLARKGDTSFAAINQASLGDPWTKQPNTSQTVRDSSLASPPLSWSSPKHPQVVDRRTREFLSAFATPYILGLVPSTLGAKLAQGFVPPQIGLTIKTLDRVMVDKYPKGRQELRHCRRCARHRRRRVERPRAQTQNTRRRALEQQKTLQERE